MKNFTIARVAFISIVIALISGYGAISMAQERLPTINPENYNAEQKKAAEDFLATRKTPVFGPFEPLMYSPNFMNTARAMGDYLRYKPAIGTKLSELVILITAREWSQDYEWFVHAPIALKQGISDDTIKAIADGRRPENMSEDEGICYDFSIELHRMKRVSEPTYQRALKRFGEKGVVDIAGISGYYTLLAMSLNMAHYKIPDNSHPLKKFPDQD
jgi:4-carboxymuconolactone decarboxylase